MLALVASGTADGFLPVVLLATTAVGMVVAAAVFTLLPPLHASI